MLVIRTSLRTRFLLTVWMVFFLLVAAGIHGSSIAIAVEQWSFGSRYSGYLIPRLTGRERGPNGDVLSELCLSKSRFIRTDEWLRNTPLVLSQLNQTPRFPVINRSVGDGQNMLLYQLAPVSHIATLARPATWGFFFLDPQRGLAWEWWLPTFGCFTCLSLLLEIILRGQRRLAAFGAFWFCASAYNVCWSLWPAWVVFFGSLTCVALYHLLTTGNARVMLVSAILAGLSVPAAAMFIYPPWLIPTGYLFLLLLVGLVVRDLGSKPGSAGPGRLESELPAYQQRAPWSLRASFWAARIRLDRLIAIGIFVLVAASLVFSFVWTCLPAFKVIAGTVYPGHRRSFGGAYGLSDYFKGFYNFYTNYNAAGGLGNESECASFFYFFPAVFAGLLLSAVFRRKLGLPGWLVVAYLLAMSVYVIGGWPRDLAGLTLMSYVPGYRADIGLGLGSIILCLVALERGRAFFRGSAGASARTRPALAAGAAGLLFLISTTAVAKRIFGLPSGWAIILPTAAGLSCYATMVSYFMLSGETRAFCVLVSLGLLSTSAFFNPLATTLEQLYDSELARQITALDHASASRPLWICYGPGDTGVLVTLLGGRAISGIQYPPQLNLWRDLDPGGEHDEQYNRDAWVNLTYQDGKEPVKFSNANPHRLEVTVAPDHRALAARGAKYILATGYAQSQIDRSRFPVVYQSPSGGFSIFNIGQAPG